MDKISALNSEESIGSDSIDYVLGSDRFKNEIAIMLNRRVVPGKAGRPEKSK